MPSLKIKIHQSLRVEGQPYEFEGSFDSGTILENMKNLLSTHKLIFDLCLTAKGKKPGLLYLADKTELASLDLLDQNMDDDMDIRIVPILHGG